jgi:Flp pilus assembly protein TadG
MKLSVSTGFCRIVKDCRGQVAITFAISAFALILAGGTAIDFISSSHRQATIQGRMDAAVLAGIASAREAIDSGMSFASAKKKAQEAAVLYYRENGGDSDATPSFDLKQNGQELTMTGDVTGKQRNLLMSMAGSDETDIAVHAASSTAAQSYENVYLLVDISASMLLPSTSEGIDKMIAGKNCALACHDNQPAAGQDSYSWAMANGISLRYQIVNEGIEQLVRYIMQTPGLQSHTKLALWSFDHQLHENAPLSNNYNTILNNFPAPAVAYDDAAAATPFNKLIADFVDAVGKGYSEGTVDKPKKMVILATDGVNDPTRAWVNNTALRSQVKAFDTKFCRDLQKNNVTVAIINTPYLPMPWDWGYEATLGQSGNKGGKKRVDDIPIVFSECAGDLYIIAGDEESIISSFTKIFQRTMTTRLAY